MLVFSQGVLCGPFEGYNLLHTLLGFRDRWGKSLHRRAFR